MLKNTVYQGLIVVGFVFVFAMIINLVTSLNMFSGQAQISYLAFFIAYIAVMYMKNRKHAKS